MTECWLVSSRRPKNGAASEAKEILAHTELSKQIARLPAGINPVIPQKISPRTDAFV
jgi:hypothetical protein